MTLHFPGEEIEAQGSQLVRGPGKWLGWGPSPGHCHPSLLWVSVEATVLSCFTDKEPEAKGPLLTWLGSDRCRI